MENRKNYKLKIVIFFSNCLKDYIATIGPEKRSTV